MAKSLAYDLSQYRLSYYSSFSFISQIFYTLIYIVAKILRRGVASPYINYI